MSNKLYGKKLASSFYYFIRSLKICQYEISKFSKEFHSKKACKMTDSTISFSSLLLWFYNRICCWHEIGTIPHKIGTVLLFPRKKGYVTLNMLKTAPKSNPGWHGTFPERCFFCASYRMIRLFTACQPKERRPCPSLWHGLFFPQPNLI